MIIEVLVQHILLILLLFNLSGVQFRQKFNARGQVFVLHDWDEVVQLWEGDGHLLQREGDGRRVLEDAQHIVSFVDDYLKVRKSWRVS